jgi:hypothetical protein
LTRVGNVPLVLPESSTDRLVAKNVVPDPAEQRHDRVSSAYGHCCAADEEGVDAP